MGGEKVRFLKQYAHARFCIRKSYRVSPFIVLWWVSGLRLKHRFSINWKQWLEELTRRLCTFWQLHCHCRSCRCRAPSTTRTEMLQLLKNTLLWLGVEVRQLLSLKENVVWWTPLLIWTFGFLKAIKTFCELHMCCLKRLCQPWRYYACVRSPVAQTNLFSLCLEIMGWCKLVRS